jgi:hypothetical protein
MPKASGKAFSRITLDSLVKKQAVGCFGEGMCQALAVSLAMILLLLTTIISLSSHQRFFLQLLLAFKVVDCVSIALEALASDCAVVIGLFSTGESHVDDRVRELDDIISAPR